MRDSQRITVVFEAGKKRYDPDLGKMVGGDPIKKVYPCHISDTGLELKNMLSDKKESDSKTIRINVPISGYIDFILLGNKKYKVLNRKSFYSRRSAIVVEETIDGKV